MNKIINLHLNEMWDGISRSGRQKTSTLRGFQLYGCLAAAQLQETHNVSEKQKQAVAIIKLFLYAQNLQQDNKMFPVQNKFSAGKTNYNSEQNKFFNEISQ